MTRADTHLRRSDASLIEALERSHIHPLWDRYQRITPLAPRPKDVPMHWRWRDIEPFTERAAKEVAIEDVERRALILAHPAFDGATVTTQNLMPAICATRGESPEHRAGTAVRRRKEAFRDQTVKHRLYSAGRLVAWRLRVHPARRRSGARQSCPGQPGRAAG